jgi:hypothetical protein
MPLALTRLAQRSCSSWRPSRMRPVPYPLLPSTRGSPYWTFPSRLWRWLYVTNAAITSSLRITRTAIIACLCTPQLSELTSFPMSAPSSTSSTTSPAILPPSRFKKTTSCAQCAAACPGSSSDDDLRCDCVVFRLVRISQCSGGGWDSCAFLRFF